MADNFKALIGIAYDVKQAQSELDRQIKSLQKNTKLALDIELTDKEAKKVLQNSSKMWSSYRREAMQAVTAPNAELVKMKQYYKDIEKQSDNFNRKNINAIDYEIKQRENSSKVFSNQIKLQMQARLDAENKVQAEIKNTAKEQKDAFNLKADRNILDNKVSSYLQENSKLSDVLKNRLIEIQKQISVADKTKLGQLKKQFQEVSGEAKLLGQTGGTVFQSLVNHASQLVGFLGATTLVIGGYRQLQNMIAEVANLNKSFVDLQQATGFSNQQTQELLNTYIDLGQQLGATGTEVADAASSWLKQGKSIADTNTLIKDSMILSKVGTLDSASSTKYLTAITKAYQISVEDTLGVVDKLSAVDMASATDVSGLSEAVSSVSANAQSVGISLDKILGIVATIGETSGEAMSSVGNSVSTMLSRMANIKLSRLTDPETGEDLSNVETSLRNVGIELRSDDKTFKNFGDVLDTVASKWNTYSDVTQRTIASSIAGKDHMNDFLILMKAYDTSLKYTTVSTQSSGEAMVKFSAYEEGVEAKTKKVQASLQELSSDTLDSQLIKSFLDLSNVFINITDKVGIFNVALTVLAGVIGAKTSLGLTSFANSITIAIGKMGVASSAAETLGMALSTAIPMAGLIIGFTLLNKLIDSQITTLKEQKQALDKSNSAFEESQNSLKSINTELETTATRIDELNAKDKLTFAEEGELKELKDITAELLLQRDIENQKAEKAATNLANTNKETYDKEFGNQSPEDLMNATGGHMTDWSLAPSLNYVMANLKDMQKVKEEIGKTKFKELGYEEFWGFNIDKLTDDSYLTKLSEYKKNILKIQDYRELTNEEQKFYELLESQQKAIYEYTNPNKWNEIKVTDIFNTEGVEKTKEELIALAKEGKLDETTITSYKNLNKAISDTDLILQKGKTNTQAFVAEMYTLSDSTDATATSTDQVTESILSLSDAMSLLAEKSKLIDSVKAEVKDLGTISTDSLNDIVSKYPELESVVAQYNAGLISTKDVLAELSRAYQTDTENYKNAVISKLGESVSFYNDVVKGLPQWVKDLANAYGLDFSNYKNLQESKLALDAEYAKKKANLAKAEAATNAIVSGSLDKDNPLRMFDVNSLDTAKQIEASMQQDFDNIDRLLGGFNSSLDSSLKIKGYTPSGSSGGSNKSDKSSKSSSSDDPYLDAYNAEKATLDHKLAMDDITEKTYYDKLEKLNNKYFKKHQKKYLEQYRQNQEEIYKGRKQLDEDAKDKAEKKAEEQLKAEQDYIDGIVDKYQKSLSDINDTASDSENGSNKQISAYTKGLKTAGDEVSYLESQLAKLKKQYKDGKISQENYTEQLGNLTDKLNEAKDSVKSYQKSIIESIKAQQEAQTDLVTDAYEKEKDAIEDRYDKELDSLNKIIDAKKKSLQADKEAQDYAKNLQKKTDALADINDRITDLSKAANSGDREAQAELKKLQEDRKKSQDELDELQADHKLSVEEDALDKLADDYQTQSDKNKTIDLDKAKTVYDDKLAKINSLYQREEELITHASEYTKKQFSESLKEINTQLSDLGIDTPKSTTNGLVNSYNDLVGIDANGSNDSKILSLLSNGKGKGLGTSELNKYISSNYGSQLSYSQMAELADLLGMSGVTAKNIVSDSKKKDEILKKLKKSGFKTGGVVSVQSSSSSSLSDLLRLMGEDTLVPVTNKERILTAQQNESFEKMINMMPSYISSMKLLTPNVSNITHNNNNNSSPIVNVTIPISGNADLNTVRQLNTSANNIAQQVAKAIIDVKRTR